MYSAYDIATYTINWCHNNQIPITNLKLQKLLYFIQGEFCRIHAKRLIEDDFYAWQLGPIVPSVYSKFAIYSSFIIPKQNQTKVAGNEEITIDFILQKYAPISTWDLVDLSHRQDPWMYNHQIFGDKSIIPYKSIETYFRGDPTQIY